MTRRIIVDASVAVKWFVPEQRSDQADALSDSGLALIAPVLLKIEVANALRKKINAGLIETEDAVNFVRTLPRYFEEEVDHDVFLIDAMRMAASIGHPIYDCVYLVMARQRDAILVTDDAAFLKRATQYGIGGAVALSDWEAAVR